MTTSSELTVTPLAPQPVIAVVGVRQDGAALQQAALISEDGPAFNLNSAQIDGSAFLAGATAHGEVNAAAAHVTGQPTCSGRLTSTQL